LIHHQKKQQNLVGAYREGKLQWEQDKNLSPTR